MFEAGNKNEINRKSVRQLVRERVQKFLTEQKSETANHRRSVSFSCYNHETKSDHISSRTAASKPIISRLIHISKLISK